MTRPNGQQNPRDHEEAEELKDDKKDEEAIKNHDPMRKGRKNPYTRKRGQKAEGHGQQNPEGNRTHSMKEKKDKS